QAEQMVVTAQAASQQRVLVGKGEGARLLQVGLSEASVLLRKIQSYSDPRLYALALVAEQLAQSRQPLVPDRVFVAGGGTRSNGDSGDGTAASSSQGRLGLLISLMVAEKSGFQLADGGPSSALQEFADRMAKQAMDAMQNSLDTPPPAPAPAAATTAAIVTPD